MASAIASSSYGRTPFAAVNPVRAVLAYRKAPGSLNREDQSALYKLTAVDLQVRFREQAHKAATGPYAGVISYEYEKGPDGLRYAVGAQTPVDTAPEPDPEATIEKMETIRAAALTPGRRSAQDRDIARIAYAQLVQAQTQLRVRDQNATQHSEERDGLLAFGALKAEHVYEQIRDRAFENTETEFARL
jgi:hypothetical protein